MTDTLTRRGALNLTDTLDRVASVVQLRHAILGLPSDVATDFAKRCDLVSDAVELTAVANQPLPKDAAEVDNTPAQDADPDVSGVTDESGGDTDDAPESDDQNKPETYYEGGDSKVAEDEDEDDDEADKEASDKKAAPEFAQPARNETGDSVEPGGSATPHWDANAIGDDRGGPYKADADESYMAGEFSQQEFHELRDKQQSGQLAALDAKLASLEAGDVEGLTAIAAEFNEKFAAPSDIARLPGIAPQQLRRKLDEITRLRQESEVIRSTYEAQLKQLKALESAEKKGIKELGDAAKKMAESGQYLAETESTLLKFTAYMTDKVPGIAQMIAREDEVKGDQKAGDFFGRIAAAFDASVSEKVEAIYEATKADLTHTTMAVRGLKVVAKTASFNDAQLKTAGVVEIAVGLREWFSGAKDAFAARILGFAGTVTQWAKGFAVRSGIISKASKGIGQDVKDAMKAIDGGLAEAGRIRAAGDDEDDDSKKATDFGFSLSQ
jgi:hypothetical protein